MGTVDMLEDLGHDVMQANSGREALELLHGRSVDLVVSDQSMPQMTGAQLATKIRESHPNLPIVLATGYADLPPDIPAGIKRLGKPFSQKELAQVVSATKPRMPVSIAARAMASGCGPPASAKQVVPTEIMLA